MTNKIEFKVGDLVEIDGEEAMVSMPNGPSGTIGVKIKGSLVMVDRTDINKPRKSTTNEAVMGMSGIGAVGMGMAKAGQLSGLARMRQLAGMSPVDPEVEDVSGDLDDNMGIGEDDGTEFANDERWGNEDETPSDVDLDDADDGNYPVAASPVTSTTSSATCAALDDLDASLATIPVGEFRSVIERLKTLTKRAEDMRLGLVMEAKGDPCWKGYKKNGMKKKDGRMVPNCIPEGEDDMMEGKGKKKKTNLAPPFTKFTANKAPQFKKGAKVAEGKKCFKDYLGEVSDEDMTLGNNPQESVKAINARMGGTPATMAAAQQAFNKLKTKGVVKSGSDGKSTMAPMGDHDFNDLLK